MLLNQPRCIVCKFSTRQEAESALNELNTAGFLINQIYIVAQDAGNPDLRTRVAIIGSLVGLGLLTMPGVAALVAVGTSEAALTTTLTGAGIGAVGCNIVKTLTRLGFAKERCRANLERLYRGEYLLMLDGTDEEVRRAKSILSS